MKTKLLVIGLALLALSTLNSQLSTVFAQGSLTPPGLPAPTMKSADEIYAKLDPRTAVNAVNTPGNASYLFIIRQPGSYYLTTNIFGVSYQSGISINTNNVMLDLNGFALQGVSGGTTANGITILNFAQTNINITVRNGTISSWVNDGVHDGTEGSSANLVFERLNVSACNRGIEMKGAGVVRNCNCQNNAIGISVIFGSEVIGNTCIGNGTGISINGDDNRIEDNHVVASSSAGISVPSESYYDNIIIKNSVSGNGANNYSGAGFSSNGNVVGPFITAEGTITSSNPWANFSF